jgi:DNA-binding CsgD family transcriptional regulator
MERLFLVKNMVSPQNRLALIKQELKKTGTLGIPMGPRLFLLLVILVFTIITGAVALMLATGTFTAGLTQSKMIVENELLHASQEISQRYGQISQQSVEFSKAVSEAIENELKDLGIPVSSLHRHPEVLEEILSMQYDRALFALQISKSSGAFLILDATVNPALENAQNSRAGLYLKNMEPNIISSSTPTIIVFRGFPSIGRRNHLSLHAQWQMEFDIENAPYYHTPMAAAASNPDLPLSRLYYWCPAFTLQGTGEQVMLCSVPLIDSTGTVFGVCGLEISDMLFKLSHMPERGIYSRLFCVLSPMSGNTLAFDRSLFAGGYSAKTVLRSNGILEIADNDTPFHSYSQNGVSLFLGLHTLIKLYPEGSAFSHENWAAAIMVPQEDIVAIISRLNLLLFSSLVLLVVVGITVSLILSRRFLRPITKGLDIIKSTDLEEAPKTKVPEIDNLIEYLKSRNKELYRRARKGKLSISLLDEFMENIKTLSPSERAVFDLYAEGYTPKQAAEKLFVSINTIKTHNKRIYMKLNVASREELLLYISMLKEIGKDI